LTCSFHFLHWWSAVITFFDWHLSVTSYETKLFSVTSFVVKNDFRVQIKILVLSTLFGLFSSQQDLLLTCWPVSYSAATSCWCFGCYYGIIFITFRFTFTAPHDKNSIQNGKSNFLVCGTWEQFLLLYKQPLFILQNPSSKSL
jgi:hypothetical protein